MQLKLVAEDALSHQQLVVTSCHDHTTDEVEANGAFKRRHLAIVTDARHKLLEEDEEFRRELVILLAHDVDVPD